MKLYTIGFTGHSAEEFFNKLQRAGVKTLLDVRLNNVSQLAGFAKKNDLQYFLRTIAGIGYVHMPALGGLRRRRPDSLNSGWENASFQGYADYMLTPEFGKSLQELLGHAGGERAALVCAEALPWRCHRSLIADALVVRGVAVEHILGASRTEPHRLRPWARVQGTRIIYPPPAEDGNRDAPGH